MARKQNDKRGFGEYEFHMPYWGQEGQQETSRKLPNEILQMDDRSMTGNDCE